VLAERGYSLGLTGRRAQRLQAVQEALLKGHPDIQVAVRQHDVTDYASTPGVMAKLSRELGGLDLVIANAGIAGSRKVGSADFQRDREIIETNLIGAMATVDASVALMRGSGGGHIVGISSVAGFRGLPGSAAYSASKAGFAYYLEAVRGEVQRYSIRVTTISPGYIDTPLNSDIKSRPFVITVDDGARRIADRVEADAIHATVPAWPWSVVGFVMRNAPDFLWTRMVGKRGKNKRA
jgi:short-subunit dehydrogenase